MYSTVYSNYINEGKYLVEGKKSAIVVAVWAPHQPEWLLCSVRKEAQDCEVVLVCLVKDPV